jgi:ABC-type antimicrobial peptide transport system permease subunit
MDEVFTESIRRPRLLAQLLTLFSALALLLAAIGTYGVLAFMVTERRREISIRLALGAERGRLLRQVMTQGFSPAATGIAVGLVGALGVSRFLRSLLFGVEPVDPLTLAIAIAVVVGMAALACWLPAWRASRLDPNVVLRVE